MAGNVESRKCPECGEGELIDITYREGAATDSSGDPIQVADSRQVETYSCGHEAEGPRLNDTAAGTDELEAERRESDETVEPPSE
jgi:hypothetical protein